MNAPSHSFKISTLWDQLHYAIIRGGGGGGVTKRKGLSWDVPLKLVAKSASWYMIDDPFSAKTCITMGHIFTNFLKLVQKLAQFNHNFLKFA